LGSFSLPFLGKTTTHIQKSIHCRGRRHPA
jgi:hypothetical protein